MSDRKYLKQRHLTWYVRVRVPPSLKPVLGYELSRTTKTRDLRVARQVRWQIVKDLKQKIAEAEARRVLGESDAGWVLNEAKRLARDVREGTTDHELALEVGLEDILKRHFKAAEYPVDPETGHPVIHSRAAEAAVEAASKIIHAGDVMLMSHAVDTYLAEIEDRIIKTTWKTKERMLGDLQRFLGDPELSRITKQSCGEYLTKQLMTAGRAVKTTKNVLTHLSAFFTWAEGRGLIPVNPISGLAKTVRAPKRGNGKSRRPWDVKELEVLFKSYDKSTPVWQVAAIGLYTGMRIEEVCQLRVGDAVKGALKVTSGKTDNAIRDVPLHADIKSLVGYLKKSSKDGYLISGLHPGGYDGKRSAAMTKRFGRMKRQLGFTDPALTFHSLRGSFIRALAEAEVPKSTQRLLVGHADGDITEQYAGGISMKRRTESVAKVKYGKVDRVVRGLRAALPPSRKPPLRT